AVFPAFMAAIRVAFIPIARRCAALLHLGVEPEVLSRIGGLILAAPVCIEAADVRNKADFHRIKDIVAPVKDWWTFGTRIQQVAQRWNRTVVQKRGPQPNTIQR